MDTWLRNLSPWRKRVGGQEKQRHLGSDETNTVEKKLRIDLADGENDRIHLKRDTLVEKDWHDNLDCREGLVFTSEYENTISERYGINTWHWSNSNTTTQNKKQSIGLQNKPEQTHDRDFVRSFCGGAHTGSIVQHHHVQGSAHDIRSIPES